MPRGWVLAFAAAALAGCGKPESATPATVTGRVTFQGRPLAGGLVVFAPDRDKGNAGKPVSAALDGDGVYRLSADGSTAVAAGWYRVAIAEAPTLDGPRLPTALRRPDKSGIEREVFAGRENVIHFDIELPEPEA